MSVRDRFRGRRGRLWSMQRLARLDADQLEALVAVARVVGREHVALRRTSPGISDRALISPLASLRFGDNLVIGPKVTIGPYCAVWGGFEATTTIGAGTLLAPGAVVVAGNHRIDGEGWVRDLGFDEHDAAIGEGAWIGANATVVGCRVGDGAVVAANAVVVDDVPAGAPTTTGAASKARVYESFGNPALLRAVRDHLPAGGSVLDLGCASGGLLAALAGDAGRRVGVEIDPVAAAAAAEHADAVHTGSVESVELGAERFDVIVLGDVLEHVADPGAVLRRTASWSAPGGRLVISLPNVAHWSVRLSLLAGRWDYADSGILDDTHLRFFTWRSGAALVESAGLRLVERRPVISGLGAHLGRRVPAPIEARWRRLGQRRPNLLAYQQLLVAEAS